MRAIYLRLLSKYRSMIGKWGTDFTLVPIKKLALTFPKNKGLVHALEQLRDKFESILGQFWCNYETSLTQLWDNFESILGQLWCNYETTLETFETILTQLWDNFESILGLLFKDNFEKALGFPSFTHVVIICITKISLQLNLSCVLLWAFFCISHCIDESKWCAGSGLPGLEDLARGQTPTLVI